jgi:hypothetical protein
MPTDTDTTARSAAERGPPAASTQQGDRPLQQADAPHSPAPLAMQVSRMFLWAGACTTALHVGLLLVSYRVRHAVPPQWRTLIDVKEEQSLQAFLTVLATALVAVTAWLRYRGAARPRGWLLLPATFLYLAADDACMIHERLGSLTHTSNTVVYAWLQSVAPIMALALAGCFVLLWRELARPALRFRLFLAYGFFAIALVLEIIEGPIEQRGLRFRGHLLTEYTKVLEEFCELIAPTILLGLLLGLGAPPAERRRQQTV